MTDDSEDDREREGDPAPAEDDPAADPFDRLADEADREGNPFDHLPGPDRDERTAERSDEAPSDREGDVLQPSDVVDPAEFAPTGDRSDGDPPPNGEKGTGAETETGAEKAGASPHAPTADRPEGGGTEASAGPADGPADDPFADVATPEGDPFEGDAGGVFERVDVDRVDPDHVWEEVAGEGAGDGDDEPPELSEAESRYAEVSKHAYCEQCEHFSAPPNVSCANPGTEIVEFVDVETVRLLNCPVVAERKELEDEG